MTETVLFILEIIGTAVFAASGALAGLQRQLDAFGVSRIFTGCIFIA